MAHEYIQFKALSDCDADGLFISPVIGAKKSGDFLTEIILKSYQMMIDKKIYPKHAVMLGGFNTYSRYSGPREAVFTAICRKNFGCSHFIIGRDHTGIQGFYKEDESRKYFEGFPSIFQGEFKITLTQRTLLMRVLAQDHSDYVTQAVTVRGRISSTSRSRVVT